MKTRLCIFISTLLLLPLAGLWLSGHEWGELAGNTLPATGKITPALITLFMLLGYALLINFAVKLRTGNSPFSRQRGYFLAMSLVSVVLGWLLFYLNHFAVSWSAEPINSFMQILLATILLALPVPAVLTTRALLGSFTALLKRLACGMAIPSPDSQTLAFILIPLAVLGLIGGVAWPVQLFWLLWSAPLLLLLALQLLWHESTIFSGLKSGDWGRVICAALSGLIVGNFAVIGYQIAGGKLQINLPNPLFVQYGYVLFGMLCLQLGDVIAESWRGKQRIELFRQKKKFPIPVVVKKS